MSAEDEKKVESSARETIDNLIHGRIGTATIKDVKNAADRALRDRGTGNAIGRSLGR